MGLFGAVKSTWKKSEAATVVQNLLEQQAQHGFFTSDPAKTATLLVAKVWDHKPDVFNGKFGQRPHKLSVAAIALSFAIDNLSPQYDDYAALIIALGNLLQELETNGSLYPLNSIDNELLKGAIQTFIEVSNSQEAESEEIPINPSATTSNRKHEGVGHLDNFQYANFESWMQVYKDAAASVNKALEPEDGLYLIDIMEDEPLRRAFKDKVDPKKLGINFGKNFDILSMGLG